MKIEIRERFILPLLFLLAFVQQTFAVTVYYDNKDSNWDKVCCYVWTDGTGDYKTWPGEPMERIGDTSVWKYEFPDRYVKVIFNNGDNGKQTADLSVSSDIVYVESGSTDKNAAEYGIVTGPDDSMTVYFDTYEGNWREPYCIYYKEGVQLNDGRGTKMENVGGSVFRLKIGAVPDQVQFTIGGTEETVKFDAVNNHVYTNTGDTGVEFLNWTTPTPDVYLYLSAPWSGDVYAYVYNEKVSPTVVNGAWPGVQMTKDGATGYWKYKVPDNLKADCMAIFTTADESSRYPAHGQEGVSVAGESMILVVKNGKYYWTDFETYVPGQEDEEASLGKYESYADENGTIAVTGTKGTLYITPWAPEVVKIFTLKKGARKTEERRSVGVVDKDDETLCYDFPEVSYSVAEDENVISVVVKGGVTVNVNKANMLVSFFEDDVLLLSESTGLDNSSVGGSSSVTFAPSGVKEAFYGGGYNGEWVNWEGRQMRMHNKQTGGWQKGSGEYPHNINIPFYVSTHGYGVYFDSQHLNATITPSSSGSHYTCSSSDPIAYYFCGGGTMEKAMQNYNLLTGHQPLPPYWMLGYITSKYSFASDNEAMQAVEKTIDAGVPIDGIVFDIHWQGGNSGAAGMGYLDWDAGNYPSKGGVMKDFLKKNVHSIAICEPYFNSVGNAAENYRILKDKGWLADEHVSANSNMSWIGGGADVGLIDITNPDAQAWFGEKYVNQIKKGLGAWWLDLGEPEAYDSDSRHHTGTPAQVQNEYGSIWLGAAYKALAISTERLDDELGGGLVKDVRHAMMPRSGTAGMQRYGAMPWTGDIKRSWEGLQAQVPALISAAMSGVSYLGSDIGGFTSTYGTMPELYRRWVQLGVFYPMMRTHSQDRPEVFNSEYAGVLDDVRDAINLRYAYLPYTYTQAYRQTAFGSPIARPINFDDKENPMTNTDCIDEYLWGPDILVAPVLTSNDTREIKFPAGDWLDMNDFKTVHEGYSSYSATVPKSQLAHFMRRGSIVPRYKQDIFTNTAEIKSNELIIDYFPLYDGSNTHSYFYDDDKTGVDNVRKGRYQLMHFTANAGEEGLKNALAISIEREGNGWEGMPETHDITFRIHDFKISTAASADETLTLSEVNVVWMNTPVAAQRSVAARADGKENWSDTEKFDKYDSLEGLSSATGNSYFHDKDNGTFYLRMPEMRTDRKYVMNLGSEMIFTGAGELVDMSSMTLAYGSGLFTYSLPEGTQDASLDVYTSTGMLVTSLGGLTANGYATQTAVDLQSGVYIAVLGGKGSDGVRRQKTVKMVVR